MFFEKEEEGRIKEGIEDEKKRREEREGEGACGRARQNSQRVVSTQRAQSRLEPFKI